MTAKGILGGEIIAVVIVIALIMGYLHYKKAETKTRAEKIAAEKYVATHPPAQQRTVEALVLEHECTTPCSANIAWKFKIRTDGHPLRIKFQGVRDEVTYPGEGDFQAPPKMTSGETKFVSADKEHPNVRVQVYRKIATVQRGR